MKVLIRLVLCVEGPSLSPRQFVRDSERQEAKDSALADTHGPRTRG